MPTEELTKPVFYRHPVDDISNITGYFGQTKGYPRPHRGIDYGVYLQPVYAPNGGYVVAHTNFGDFGKSVCIKHESGWYSIFAHLDTVFVNIGAWVSTGTPIGISGNTGLSSGYHLHWQVCKTPTFPVDISQSIDPLAYIVEIPKPENLKEDDMTEDEIFAVIAKYNAKNNIADTTAVLSCIAQIVGAEENTYSDTARIERVRNALKAFNDNQVGTAPEGTNSSPNAGQDPAGGSDTTPIPGGV